MWDHRLPCLVEKAHDAGAKPDIFDRALWAKVIPPGAGHVYTPPLLQLFLVFGGFVRASTALLCASCLLSVVLFDYFVTGFALFSCKIMEPVLGAKKH